MAWMQANCSWNMSGLLDRTGIGWASEVRKRHLVSAMCRLTAEEEGRRDLCKSVWQSLQCTGAAALIEVPDGGLSFLANAINFSQFYLT